MMLSLVMLAALATGPTAPAPAAAHPPAASMPLTPLQEQEMRDALASPFDTQPQLPPPCPPQKDLPLNGFVTLPVGRLGLCNSNDWREPWYQRLLGPDF
jgi:hypothetical protein